MLSIHPKRIHDSTQSQLKFQLNCFQKLIKFAPKFIWENKSPQNTNSSFKNTKKEALVLTDIKTNCTSRVIKLVWYWLKNKESNEGKERAKTQKLNLQ